MRLVLLISALLTVTSASAQLPRVASGRIVRWEKIGDRNIAPRNIDIWLPQDYDPARKYAVLYMHDGQMLFDSAITWNKQEWMADETAGRLLSESRIRPMIIVGIWNNGAFRHQEYFPEKPLLMLDSSLSSSIIRNELKGKAMADEYLRFIVYTLKPMVDSAFSTRKERSATFIAGSSMGGLISMYAFCEYPYVFGGAACLSTHWPGSLRLRDPAIPNAFNAYLKANLPSPAKRRIYFDLGDGTLDSLYGQWQELVDGTMRAKGYGTREWVTRTFPGDDHSERAWQRRLHEPFIFLMGRKQKARSQQGGL